MSTITIVAFLILLTIQIVAYLALRKSIIRAAKKNAIMVDENKTLLALDKANYQRLRENLATHNVCPVCGKLMRSNNKLTICAATGQLHPEVHPWRNV